MASWRSLPPVSAASFGSGTAVAETAAAASIVVATVAGFAAETGDTEASSCAVLGGAVLVAYSRDWEFYWLAVPCLACWKCC